MKSLAELKKIKEEEEAKKQVELINRMTEEIKADMHETVKAELKEKIEIMSESKKDIITECRNLNNQLLAVNNRLAELEKKYKDVKTEKKTILKFDGIEPVLEIIASHGRALACAAILFMLAVAGVGTATIVRDFSSVKKIDSMFNDIEYIKQKNAEIDYKIDNALYNQAGYPVLNEAKGNNKN